MSNGTQQHRTLEGLIAETRAHLVSLDYGKDTLRHMDNCWKTFANHAKSKGVVYFSFDFGLRFLMERYSVDPFTKETSSYRRTMSRAITALADYHKNGFVSKRRPTRQHVWHEGYRDACVAFMGNAASRLAKSSLRLHRCNLERFANYMVSIGIHSVSDITPDAVDGYIETYAGYSKRTVSYACYVMKSFFNFALDNGYITQNLASFVPKVKVDYRSNLPSVFTESEVKDLLLAVDRGNPQGKRDYAMLLLAVRYGMRVGDITSLKLNGLDFAARKIRYTQNKTGDSVSLDMLEGVGWALIDYLKNARPKTDSPNVFVRLNAPFDAFADSNNLSNLMQKYLRRAGIKQTSDRHHGIHTLRHSFASRLLQQGNPIQVVSAAINHKDINSSMIYAKIDMPMLSLCPLEVPNDTE